jgi:TolB-like protein/Tfp pilus assembly protein PilF
LNRFINELRRRNVVRVGLAYLAVAWLIIQLIGEIGPILELPAWIPKLTLGLLSVGFVITLVLAWVYELTNKGLKRTEEVDRDETLHSEYSRQLNYIIIGALTLALSYFFWESRLSDRQNRETRSDSIAVLPFRDMSPHGDQEYFADGIAEELLGALSKIPGLKVAGRTSSFAFKNKDEDLRSIARKLGVTHILEGSVRTAGSQLRVTAQLIKAEDGFQVWTREFDRNMSAVFEVQDEIAGLVVEGLRLHLGTGGETGLPPIAATPNIDAYDQYLHGRFQLARRTADSMVNAEKYFRAAIASDPSYSPAWSALATTLAVSPYYRGIESLPALAADAKDAAGKAIDLDAKNSEAYAALGVILLGFDRNWGAAAEAFTKAVEIHPNDAGANNFYGDYLYATGNFQEAEFYEKRAAELEPLSAANQHELALVYGFLGRWDEAIALERMAVDLSPEFRNAWTSLARMLFETGRDDELSELLATHGGDMGERFSLWIRCRQSIAGGNREQAAADAAGLLEMTTREDRSLVEIALLYALLEEDGQAAQLLSASHDRGDPILASPLYFFLPEDWPALTGVRRALEQPDMAELFDLRRANAKAGKGRATSGQGYAVPRR